MRKSTPGRGSAVQPAEAVPAGEGGQLCASGLLPIQTPEDGSLQGHVCPP